VEQICGSASRVVDRMAGDSGEARFCVESSLALKKPVEGFQVAGLVGQGLWRKLNDRIEVLHYEALHQKTRASTGSRSFGRGGDAERSQERQLFFRSLLGSDVNRTTVTQLCNRLCVNYNMHKHRLLAVRMCIPVKSI
jgi:hypothetical protein